MEEVAAPRPNKMDWTKERKEMLLTQITACGLSAFMTCRGNKKPDKNGKGGIKYDRRAPPSAASAARAAPPPSSTP